MVYLKRTAGRLLGITAGGMMALLGLMGCDQFKAYPKNIQEFPEPWQMLEPGKPQNKLPRIEIVSQGKGPAVESGDLVQLHLRSYRESEKTWHDRGEWWIWIGFRSSKETAFFSYEPGVAGALVGMRQATSLRFLDAQDNWVSAGKLRPNPFGDPDNYSWRKNTQEFANIYIPYESGYSLVEVKRVCKGNAQYRTVRLFDDGPVQVHGGSRSYTSHEPRETWFDEARIEAKCEDGKTAIFQYGPTDSRNGKTGRSPVIGYFDRWFHDAWEKIPKGVQLK